MTLGWWLGGTFFVQILLVAAVFYLLPAWSRPEIYFAVTVPAGFRGTAAGRQIRDRYRRWVAAGSALALVLVAAAVPADSPGLMVAAAFLQIGLALGAFLGARRGVLPHAQAPAEVEAGTLPPGADSQLGAETGPGPEALPGGAAGLLGPFLLLGAMAAYLAWRWQEIPDRFISHWDDRWQPNGWMDKSVPVLFGPLVTGALLCAGLALLAWGLMRWSRRVHSTGPSARAETSRRRAVAGLVLAMSYLMALVFGAIGLVPFLQTPAAARAFTVALLAGAVIVPVVLLVAWFLRHGKQFTASARQEEASVPAEAPIGDRTPDACWKAGLFYYNPDDPALLVEKRFGIGYTFNFARPAAWWLLAALLLLPLVPLLVMAFW